MEELIKLTGGTPDHHEDDDELVKALLNYDNVSAFFMQPHHHHHQATFMDPSNHSTPSSIHESAPIISPVYSGPTVEDIESALSYNLHHEANRFGDNIYLAS